MRSWPRLGYFRRDRLNVDQEAAAALTELRGAGFRSEAVLEELLGCPKALRAIANARGNKVCPESPQALKLVDAYDKAVGRPGKKGRPPGRTQILALAYVIRKELLPGRGARKGCALRGGRKIRSETQGRRGCVHPQS